MNKLLCLPALSMLLIAALDGCGNEQPPQRHAEQRTGMAKVGETQWLSEQDDIKPELWLIEHETKLGGNPPASDAGEVRRALSAASEKFHDTPRMIANRAVQLEDMLKGAGGDETAVVLINRLTGIIAANRIESFGAAGQQYYNLRKAGLTGEQAFDALSKRYGSPS
jgi:hypothetical protein